MSILLGKNIYLIESPFFSLSGIIKGEHTNYPPAGQPLLTAIWPLLHIFPVKYPITFKWFHLLSLLLSQIIFYSATYFALMCYTNNIQ